MGTGKPLNDRQNALVRGWALELIRRHDGNSSAAAKAIGVNQSTLASFVGGKDGLGEPRQGTSFLTALDIAVAIGMSKVDALRELEVLENADNEPAELLGGPARIAAESSLRALGFTFSDVRAAGDEVASHMRPDETPDVFLWKDLIEGQLRRARALARAPSTPPPPMLPPARELTAPETRDDWKSGIKTFFASIHEDERDELGTAAVGYGKMPTDDQPQAFDAATIRVRAQQFLAGHPPDRRPRAWTKQWRPMAHKLYGAAHPHPKRSPKDKTCDK